MQKLIEKVAADAGISAEQSEKAINSVRDYIKAATPYFFHQQLDVILNGGTLSEAFKKKFQDIANDVEDAAKDLGKKAEEFASEIGKKINETFNKM